MPWKRSLDRGLHHLGRVLLWLFIIFLGIMWTVACFVFVMTGYCLVGCCRNLAEHREGGCHDLPLICEGISVSADYSADGWRCLWSYMEMDDSMCLHNTIGLTYLSYLPPDSRRSFDWITSARTVSVLWEFRWAHSPWCYTSFAPRWILTVWPCTHWHSHLHTKGCPTRLHFHTTISISNTPDRRRFETCLHFHPQCTNPHINPLHKLISYSTRPRRMGPLTLARRRCHDKYSKLHT